MPISTFKIYTIENIDYDKIIAKYRELCELGEKEVDAGSISVFGGDLKYVQTRKSRKALKDDTRILNKAMYLVHTIAYRQITNREENVEGASIKYSILQSVLGEDVYELLKALDELGYIEIDGRYTIGKSSKHYKVIGNIKSMEYSNRTILKYIDKSKQLLKDAVMKRMETPEFKALYGDSFAHTYIKNLNKFKVKDEIGLNSYINNQIELEPKKEPYYNFIKESLNNEFKIFSIDNNNRIYHLLTSLERELKPYFNINFSIDCKNSHPVLFNYFIFSNKGISLDTSYLFSSILFSISYSEIYSKDKHYYDIEKLCNILINNGIDKSTIAMFEKDELLYLWKTTIGRFWDDILDEHINEGYDRAEIKEKMFAEVFYSKTPRIAWKEFAKEFKHQYPNVYDLILKWKEPLNHTDLKACLLEYNKAVQLGDKVLATNPETALPNVMMSLESSIFREILKALYRKRISAVHIHDAIVIPHSRIKVEEQKIEDVMRGVYKKYGLHPTFSIDKY